jgi:CBS domain-containing protein
MRLAGAPHLPPDPECDMRISEAMTREVRIAAPDQTICEAARMMAECDAGALPVGDNDRLVGLITDRDIAIRAVAEHRSPDTPVRDVMSAQVLYCYEDDDAEQVARNMAQNQVRRLPVMSRDKRLVGIVSFGDVSHNVGSRVAGKAIADISQREVPATTDRVAF